MHDSTQPIIEASGLAKHFGARKAVDGLDLRVPPGICFGLLGPNGAGKTTALRMIYGVTEPTCGSLRVFGLDVATNRRAIRARLGVTLQEDVMVEALDCKDNLRIFGRYHRLDRATCEARSDELIESLELASHRGLPVRNLSGGFRRRLAIAMSLMNRPELLILDEPTTGLDPAVRRALWSRIRRLRAEGTTVVLTTHYMEEAERLCDLVAILAAGRCLDIDSPERLIARNLAPQTVEIDCERQEEEALLAGLASAPARTRSGDRLALYTENAEALVAHIHTHSGFGHRPITARPTNLEDVFLTLTGTSLEEAS